MKKWIVVILLIAVLGGALYGIYAFQEKKQESKPVAETNALNEAKVIELLDDKNAAERQRILQLAAKSPDQVIALNSLILKITYSRDLKKEEMDELIKLQRSQFSPELLEKNEEESQQLKVWAEVERQRNQKVKIVDFKALAPYNMEKVKYNGVARQTVKVSVVFYSNVKGNNYYIDYLLYEDDQKQWKIAGWAKGEEFLVTE
jgi:hypothetical protein